MDKEKLNIILFASGTKDGGGSGVENLKDATRRSLVDANIVAVVSNHEHGGVQEHSRRLGIPFIYFPEPYTSEMYRSIVERTSAGFIVLCGWLKPVRGLPMHLVINIHPGPLPETGGKGMHGLHVHKHVIQLLNEGRRFDSYNGIEDHITQISIHAVEDFDYAKKKYDTGKLLFRRDIPLDTTPIDTLTPETLENIVHPEEHFIYPLVIDLWTHGDIFFIKDTVYQSDRTVRFIKTLYQFDMGNITKDELMRDFIESRNMHT